MHSPNNFSGYTLLIIPSTFIWCTLLIIPKTVKTVAEHNQHLHTPDNSQRPQLFLCTLLINLVDAHSSLFHWLYMMHTPLIHIQLTDRKTHSSKTQMDKNTLLINNLDIAQTCTQHVKLTPSSENNTLLWNLDICWWCTLLTMPHQLTVHTPLIKKNKN